jgi:hypothetical protein
MAEIKINDLHPAGCEFFTDRESYLSDLTEEQFTIWGGVNGDSFVTKVSAIDVQVVSFIQQVDPNSKFANDVVQQIIELLSGWL